VGTPRQILEVALVIQQDGTSVSSIRPDSVLMSCPKTEIVLLTSQLVCGALGTITHMLQGWVSQKFQ
jgi:hypothetical protein